MSNQKYGPTLKTEAAENFSIEIFKKSRKEKAAGRKGFPVCAWGPAGIGKTELPNMLANKYADMFDGNIVYLPMAQIEEKAELQGLPELLENITEYTTGENIPPSATKQNRLIDGKIKEFLVRASTVYATPSWIPQADSHGEKGILVIDDMNRADERIINSIMQLLQDGKLLGWALPEKWEIYCTCNPDDGHYQVTSFDGAQMTRICNYYQEFDPKSWLKNWAEPSGLHPAAQNFALSYPEAMVQGERTNPRSFDKFFRLIEDDLEDLKGGGSSSNGSNIVQRIKTYGLMNIDEEALSTFVTFITQGFGKLPNVEEILSPKFNLDGLYNTVTTNDRLRVDIISSLDTRINLFVKQQLDSTGSIKEYREGILKWMKHSKLPGELRYKSVKSNTELSPGLADRELAEIIFSRTL